MKKINNFIPFFICIIFILIISLPHRKKNIEHFSPVANIEEYYVILENDNYILVNMDTGVRQSGFHKDTYYNKFDYAREMISQIKNLESKKDVCILGFGLGGIPLELSLDDNIENIDCVDIDERVYKLFRNIIKKPKECIHFHLNDVVKYLKKCNKKYDVIIDDVFTNTKIFFVYKLIHDKLKDGGVLFINMHHMDDFKKYRKRLEELFKSVSLKVKNEIVITCVK